MKLFKRLGIFQQTMAFPDPGVHHYLRQSREENTRLHLRLEKDGHGVLLVNAARLFHFNPTAAAMAYMFLESAPAEQVVATLTRKYRVPGSLALKDYNQFVEQLQEIIKPDGLCPICDMELETIAPFSSKPSAPYRMDLAITYHCNNNCSHCYNARPRQQLELNTEEWKNILDGLWDIGIPHIVFTGGEPTLRSDLPELIAYAEKKGQITGINTNGRRLKNPTYVDQLVSAGLDHVQITLESHDAKIHDQMVAAPGAWEDTVAGIKNAVASNLFVMTNTTLLKTNSPFLQETLDFLAEIGVPTIGLNALIYSGHGLETDNGIPEADLPPLLNLARASTQQKGQRLIWYTPTCYSNFNPVQLELGVKGCTAALYNMCIEPDGSVIPCQSYYESLGKFTEKPWEEIWNHELAVNLRERHNLPEGCNLCSFKPECGGGCPLARQASLSFAPIPIQPQLIT